MQYEGPIYRPPSEADSLLVQATVGCPHNKCSFCMVYKKGPRFKIRPVEDICRDLEQAAAGLGRFSVRTLFFPAGNTLAMPTKELAAICRKGRELFPKLSRITTYASVNSILSHGPEGLALLRQAGLTRLHVGLETGHAATLARVKKGCTPGEQVMAGTMALEAGLQLCLYILLGLAGPKDFPEAAKDTVKVVNRINQAGELTLRLRTLVPKVGTLLLHQIKKGRFTLCSPHQVLQEARALVERLNGPADLFSDHYTNYLNLSGRIPDDKNELAGAVTKALTLPREAFRADFVGTQ